MMNRTRLVLGAICLSRLELNLNILRSERISVAPIVDSCPHHATKYKPSGVAKSKRQSKKRKNK